ncbi:hypothetical protein Hdeb2414_s0006g00221471 [Helianthus debilis subsp. tardiflorus]
MCTAPSSRRLSSVLAFVVGVLRIFTSAAILYNKTHSNDQYKHIQMTNMRNQNHRIKPKINMRNTSIRN